MSLPNVTVKEDNYSIKPTHWFKGKPKDEAPTADMDAKQQFWVKDHYLDYSNTNSMKFATVDAMETFALWLIEQAEGLRAVEAKMTEKLEAGTHYCENGQFKPFEQPKPQPKAKAQSKPKASSVSSKIAENLTF